MLAEIHGKLSTSTINKAVYMEDELTGNFFGTLRYMPFNRGLKQILLHAKSKDPKFKELLASIDTESFKLDFWKRCDKGEIDTYIRAGGLSIGVEVKYGSDLSGENQLEREAAMLSEYWSPRQDSLLLLVAPINDAEQIYQENRHKKCFKHVHLVYLNWEDILEYLDDIETQSTYETLMVKDLKDLLTVKGLTRFHGFLNCKQPKINENQYYVYRSILWPDTKATISKDKPFTF